jgi:hypothetical protein
MTKSKFKPGDKVYWWSELVTVIKYTKRGFFLCHREASSGTKITTGEPYYYSAQDQEIHGSALTTTPNNALKEIVSEFLAHRQKSNKMH